MKEYLIKHGDDYIEYELDGLKMSYTFSDELKTHYVDELQNLGLLDDMKLELEDEYRYGGFEAVWMTVSTVDFHEKYFKGDHGYVYNDIRDREEIHEYLDEATDKVWLMRSCRISDRTPAHEVSRPAMERILNTYKDIPKDGYSTWECGYWNGIMGALRWVLGDEKDWLDT